MASEDEGDDFTEEEDSGHLAQFQGWREQLAVAEQRLAEVQREVEALGKDQEMNTDKLMIRLRDQGMKLSSISHDLVRIVDDDTLSSLLDEDTPLSPEAAIIHSKTELLQAKAKDISRLVDTMTSELQRKMDDQRDNILHDLEDLEAWLNLAYSVVLLEPNRYQYPEGLVDDEFLHVQSEESSICSEEEGPRLSGPAVDGKVKGQKSGQDEEEGGVKGQDEGERSNGDSGAEEEGELKVQLEDGGEGQSSSKLAALLPEEVSEVGVSNGVNGREEEQGEEPEEEGEGASQSGTMTSGEEGSQSQSEGTSTDSLDWIRDLRLIPMFHAPGLRKELGLRRASVDEQDLDHLLSDLKKLVKEMPIQSQNVKKVKANTNFLINSLSSGNESAASYKKRLQAMLEKWEVLDRELNYRYAQLAFEKAQKSTLECILEAMNELDNQPGTNLLPEEVEEKHKDLIDFIISVDQFESLKTEQLAGLEEALGELSDVSVEGEEEVVTACQDTVDQYREAYEQLTKKIKEHKYFLEKCMEWWAEFNKLLMQCEAWLDKAMSLVAKETYGYTLKEAEAYSREIKLLWDCIPKQEELGAQLVSLGKSMLVHMEEGSQAEKFVDQQLTSVEGRMSDLVTPHTGLIDVRDTDIKKVITDWKGYTGMLAGTRSFINQMSKIVGPEPKETSNGDVTLLPTYRTYANQVRQMEMQYRRLRAAGECLAANPCVGSHANFSEELKSLAMQWDPLRDNVNDTLDLLIREYNDWILMRLQQMSECVARAESLLQKELSFLQAFPSLDRFLQSDADKLLDEADSLISSHDRLNQIEVECTQIDEKLLERQIQQETSTAFSGSQSDLEYSSTATEKNRLQEARERLQTRSDALLPVLNIVYLQLQLLQHIQGSKKLISRIMDSVLGQAECKRLLGEVESSLSEDYFYQLHSQGYDAGSVTEEVQETMANSPADIAGSLPPYSNLVGINKSLITEVEQLSSSADQAKLRLQLFIQWWEEYHGNYDDVLPWLDKTEGTLNDLVTRLEATPPPRPSPIDMLEEMKALSADIEDKSIVLCALEATAQNIMEEMELKDVDPKEMGTQVTSVRSRWEELRKRVDAHLEQLQVSAEKFTSFLTRLTGLMSWMNEFHSRLYDEVCVQLPAKAPEELISRHQSQLEVFRLEMVSHQEELEWVRTGAQEEWAEHLVPEAFLADLPSPSEPSPAPEEEVSEFPPPHLLPYVKKQERVMADKWATIQRLLAEREQQLETSSSGYQTFTERAQKILQWLREKSTMEALSETPMADLHVIEGFQRDIQSTRDELCTRLGTLNALEHMAASLRGEVTSANAQRLEEVIEEVKAKLADLDRDTKTKDEVLGVLVERLRDFNKESAVMEVWLKEKEAEFEECGTIGANLDRCKEQTGILQRLDGEILQRKFDSERIQDRGSVLAKDLKSSNSGTNAVLDWVSDYKTRYAELCEGAAERMERCEEAIALLQVYMDKIKVFEEWLAGVEAAFEKRKKEKKPIGTLQTVLDDHYDFMRDIETHTEDYLVLVPEGRGLMEEYLPNDWLGNVMQTLKDKWFGYVNSLIERCDELKALLSLWEHYEKDVKELLEWIMAEADSFSKDVTAKGDKGIVDHMQTCENFMETLEGKHLKIADIADQATILKAEDCKKKNGTSDVESRWNDVHMHWNSSCKLLKETLLHLEATEAEMRHVLLIRGEEFEHLEACEERACIKRQTAGNLDRLREEIQTHECLLEEVSSREEVRLFLLSTVPFLVEHSRKDDREEMQLKADEFSQRHTELQKSITTYVSRLKDSIPFWEKFNSHITEHSEWLTRVNEDLESDNVQFGSAAVTERSLRFCQGLQADILDHTPVMKEVGKLGELLAECVVPDDQHYVMEWVEKLTKEEAHITKETDEKTELLEERLKSWRVFPVEEARVVQEFLEQAGGEVEMEELPEDLSSEELLQKLERLESLQQLQTTNQSKVHTINQSAQDAEVQRALQKNPDISKERTDLLQGWSSMSTTLQNRVAFMRGKAKMVQDLEVGLRGAEEGVAAFREHLDTPLPPSVLLVEKHREIVDEGVVLCDNCQAGLNELKNRFNQYEGMDVGGGQLTIPQHFRNKSENLLDEFDGLLSRDEEHSKVISSLVKSWPEFVRNMEMLTSLVEEQNIELCGLKVVEDFAMEFSSHQMQLQTISDTIEEHGPVYTSLLDHAHLHTEGAGPEVEEARKQFNSLKQSWECLKEDLKALTEQAKPWENLTDQFDQLSVSLGELEQQVEQDIQELEELDGGEDLSDRIVHFKEHTNKQLGWTATLAAVREGVAELLPQEVCEQHDACDALRSEFRGMEEKWEKLSQRIEETTAELLTKETVWKERASHCIRQVQVLELELAASRESLKRKDTELQRLKRARTTPAPAQSSSGGYCTSFFNVFMVGVVIVAVAAITYVSYKKREPSFVVI